MKQGNNTARHLRQNTQPKSVLNKLAQKNTTGSFKSTRMSFGKNKNGKGSILQQDTGANSKDNMRTSTYPDFDGDEIEVQQDEEEFFNNIMTERDLDELLLDEDQNEIDNDMLFFSLEKGDNKESLIE